MTTSRCTSRMASAALLALCLSFMLPVGMWAQDRTQVTTETVAPLPDGDLSSAPPLSEAQINILMER